MKLGWNANLYIIYWELNWVVTKFSFHPELNGIELQNVIHFAQNYIEFRCKSFLTSPRIKLVCIWCFSSAAFVFVIIVFVLHFLVQTSKGSAGTFGKFQAIAPKPSPTEVTKTLFRTSSPPRVSAKSVRERTTTTAFPSSKMTSKVVMTRVSLSTTLPSVITTPSGTGQHLQPPVGDGQAGTKTFNACRIFRHVLFLLLYFHLNSLI